MNKRRGLKRLAIAVGVPWAAFWALVGWIGYTRANDPFADPYQQANGNRQVGEALVYGLVLPIAILAVIALAYWVYRGFKPNP